MTHQEIEEYIIEIKSLYRQEANEHTYRTPLENLLKHYSGDNQVWHEATNDDVGFPDFTLKSNDDRLIGFVECKDIGSDLKAMIAGKSKSYKSEHKQLKKYLTMADSIVFTDYVEFYLLRQNENTLEELDYVKLFDDIESKKEKLEQANLQKLETFITGYFDSKPIEITKQDYFVSLLAKRTKILRDEILSEMSNENSHIRDIKKLFDETIFRDLDNKDFADAFSQIIAFGLLFYRLSEKEKVSVNAFQKMPDYIPVFREFFEAIKLRYMNSRIQYSIESIINAVNAYDDIMFYNGLSYKDRHDKATAGSNKNKSEHDPFIYMYERFLKEFDPKARNAHGVFYTPIEAVSYLVRSTDEILKQTLNLDGGLRNKEVHILDFATGTGTFLLGTIEHIYNDLVGGGNAGIWKDSVAEFILKQLYGFELLIVPYVLAHFRIHEFLSDCEYQYKDGDRLQLYLTNTLDNMMGGKVAMFPKMNEEADMAYKIKNEKPILVIMGNPPYNNKSPESNSKEWISNLLKDYKKNLSEKKINLDDDYIKFIRFAHWKMQDATKGVVSVIVNNSFVNGITHRQMRAQLMKTFDEIYIFDLHGNVNKGEKCPDGSMDFNIFDIKDVGVCMALFIKTGKADNPNRGVYFQEIFGTQKDKRYTLLDRSINIDKQNSKWQKIEDDKKWHWFSPVASNVNYIEKFIGLHEIFEVVGSGFSTERDSITIHQNENDLKQTINDFNNLSEDEIKNKYNTYDSRDWKILKAKKDIEENLKLHKHDLITKIYYRPFDFRYTYYTGTTRGFIGTPSKKISQSFIDKENIGLVFTRVNRAITNGYFFITENTVDRHGLDSAGDSMVVAPLYVYDEADKSGLDLGVEKRANFTANFEQLRKSNPLLKGKSPEQILYYIYAVLYSPTYRSTYKDDLSYDYPRVPFSCSQEAFDKLEDLGRQLCNLHLLRVPSASNHGFPISGDNVVCKKPYVELVGSESRLYINEAQYFTNVSEEVFGYSIGGYRVLEKYLKARELLNWEDIVHLSRVVGVIEGTMRLQGEIDQQSAGLFGR